MSEEDKEEEIGPLEVKHTGKGKGTKEIANLMVFEEKEQGEKQDMSEEDKEEEVEPLEVKLRVRRKEL